MRATSSGEKQQVLEGKAAEASSSGRSDTFRPHSPPPHLLTVTREEQGREESSSGAGSKKKKEKRKRRKREGDGRQRKC